MSFQLPVFEIIVDNILSIYDQASQFEYAYGCIWYREAAAYCRNLAIEFGYSPAKIACAVAALSPRNSWEDNKRDMRYLLWTRQPIDEQKVADIEYFGSMRLGDKPYKPRAYEANIDKANQILSATTDWQLTQHQQALDLLDLVGKGFKTRAFAQLLSNPNHCEDIVCVDTHAISVALGYRCLESTTTKVFPSRTRYNAIAQAYLVAAQKAGIKGYQMQAVTWVTWKRMENI